MIDKDADVVKVVQIIGRKLGLTDAENKGVLQHLIQGGDLSRFGLYNAVTAYSSTVESYDRATELERAGGAILELPPSDWKEVQAAA